ncbi:hypothetical protein [Psychroserpens mesophilus]|uniref:hypothetical protein n=1 Tax=Psychroserpens mesophilus TaxID=325473 RepID=UPI003D65C627
MACNTKLTNDILFSCTDLPIKGLDGGKAVILNFTDIDKSSSTTSGATITSLVSDAVGYSVEWYRELASTATSYTPNADDYDGYSHSFLFRLPTTSADNAERLNEFKNGLFVVVVETNYKGTDSGDAYKVYGWDSGMRLSEASNASNENSGVLVTLATSENSYENHPYMIFNEGSYSASTASFTTAFDPS